MLVYQWGMRLICPLNWLSRKEKGEKKCRTCKKTGRGEISPLFFTPHCPGYCSEVRIDIAVTTAITLTEYLSC